MGCQCRKTHQNSCSGMGPAPSAPVPRVGYGRGHTFNSGPMMLHTAQDGRASAPLPARSFQQGAIKDGNSWGRKDRGHQGTFHRTQVGFRHIPNVVPCRVKVLLRTRSQAIAGLTHPQLPKRQTCIQDASNSRIRRNIDLATPQAHHPAAPSAPPQPTSGRPPITSPFSTVQAEPRSSGNLADCSTGVTSRGPVRLSSRSSSSSVPSLPKPMTPAMMEEAATNRQRSRQSESLIHPA